MCMLEKVNMSFFLAITESRGLVNPLQNQSTTAAQKHDLTKFHHLGRELFEQRIQAYYFKNPSVKVPQRRKKPGKTTWWCQGQGDPHLYRHLHGRKMLMTHLFWFPNRNKCFGD